MDNQRWEMGHATYRPAGEVIDTAMYEVAPVSWSESKAFVERNHYLGTYPARRFSYGLFRAGRLVGVAVFSHPSNNATLDRCFGRDARLAGAAVELGRL